MKLTRKILPLFGLATTCITIPVAMTSCGTKEQEFVNLLNRYVPSVKQLDVNDVTTAQAIDTYIDAAVNDPMIFTDDFYWYSSNSVMQTKDNAKIYLMRLRDVSVKKATYKEKNMPLVSFEMDYQVEYSGPIEGTSNIHSVLYNGTSRYSNIPYVLDYNVLYELWQFSWFEDCLSNSEYCRAYPWSISHNFYRLDTYTIENDPYYGDYSYSNEYTDSYAYDSEQVVNNTLDETDLETISTALNEDCIYDSWYLYNLVWMGA